MERKSWEKFKRVRLIKTLREHNLNITCEPSIPFQSKELAACSLVADSLPLHIMLMCFIKLIITFSVFLLLFLFCIVFTVSTRKVQNLKQHHQIKNGVGGEGRRIKANTCYGSVGLQLSTHLSRLGQLRRLID